MPCCVDLHVHTLYSDGSDTPESILEQAACKKIQFLSFTDHDSMYWLKDDSVEYRRNAASQGIQLIRGIELSTRDTETGKKAHLLAYWPGDVPFKFGNVSLIVSATRKMRNNIALQQIEMLKTKGYAINYEDVLKQTRDGQIFKHHIMLELVNHGYAKKMNGSYYNRFFGKNGELSIKKAYPDTIEVLRAIHEDGGIAVLAHPGENNNHAIIKKLKDDGLSGVECYHPSHSEDYRKIIRKIAIDNELFLTAGSDYHGKYYRSGILGNYIMTDSEMSKIICAFSL